MIRGIATGEESLIIYRKRQKLRNRHFPNPVISPRWLIFQVTEQIQWRKRLVRKFCSLWAYVVAKCARFTFFKWHVAFGTKWEFFGVNFTPKNSHLFRWTGWVERPVTNHGSTIIRILPNSQSLNPLHPHENLRTSQGNVRILPPLHLSIRLSFGMYSNVDYGREAHRVESRSVFILSRPVRHLGFDVLSSMPTFRYWGSLVSPLVEDELKAAVRCVTGNNVSLGALWEFHGIHPDKFKVNMTASFSIRHYNESPFFMEYRGMTLMSDEIISEEGPIRFWNRAKL